MKASTLAGAAYLALLGGKTVATLRGARQAPAPRAPSDEELGRVVVAQPILSGDPGLRDALADNLRELAGAWLVWLVDDDDPEAQRIAAELADHHVLVISCPPAPDGVNPKLWKLRRALEKCGDNDVFVVLDDDTRLPAASLGALLDGLEDGMVATGLPAYLPSETLWARLVEQFVDNNAALTYLSLPPVTLNGMTYALRVRDLRALGGFEPVQRSLTDDLAVAGLVHGAGGRIVQTASPQWIATTVDGPEQYARIMHRWFLFATILLKRQPPGMVAAISGLHGTPPLLLWAVLAGSVRSRKPWPALVVLGVRAATLAGVQKRIYGRSLHRPVTSLVAELTQPVHLTHASVRRTITWRTRRYRVVRKSRSAFRATRGSAGVDDADFRPI
ncbi:glycosyltransferase [Nocardioides speluncae]|uniref:glycosyltransferase n=1 Tax=Nocardioides speluncae TaxID=2670337 RepID=UPI00197DC7F5|nr:glycosyltransferase [Nocardioides speluncae]